MVLASLAIAPTACGNAEPEDAATTGDEDTAEPPQCVAASCGDGIVGLDEACDDANADEKDGCTADCRRIAPTVVAPLQGVFQDAVVLADGGILAWRGGPTATLVRLGPDGVEQWSTAFSSGQRIRVSALLEGDTFVVLGDVETGGAWSGMTWRFGRDGAALPTVEDPSGRVVVDGGLASAGGTLVLVGADAGYFVEQQSSDATAVWSRAADPSGTLSLHALAVVDDGLAFAVGGVPGPGEAAIVRVTPEAADAVVLSPPEFPNAFFYGAAPDGEGGAIAAGVSDVHPFVARVTATGELAWVSTCTATGARADRVAVIDGRILLHGWRARPDPNCGDVCFGATWAWLQHLGLDGALIATDAPEWLVTEEEYVYETAIAVARGAAGEVAVVALSREGAGAIARFPW